MFDYVYRYGARLVKPSGYIINDYVSTLFGNGGSAEYWIGTSNRWYILFDYCLVIIGKQSSRWALVLQPKTSKFFSFYLELYKNKSIICLRPVNSNVIFEDWGNIDQEEVWFTCKLCKIVYNLLDDA